MTCSIPFLMQNGCTFDKFKCADRQFKCRVSPSGQREINTFTRADEFLKNCPELIKEDNKEMLAYCINFLIHGPCWQIVKSSLVLEDSNNRAQKNLTFVTTDNKQSRLIKCTLGKDKPDIENTLLQQQSPL